MRTTTQIIIRILIVIGGFMLLMAVFLYFYIFNPNDSQSFFITCSFRESTGLDCVGCGAQRAVHALLHGNIVQALRYNAFFVFMLPCLVIYLYFELRRFIWGIPSPHIWLYKHKFGIILIIVIILFMVLRNIPYQPFIWLNSSY